ncbi:MAG: hypothetical protein FH753_11605 [Firmicutes bacterium]|nr:hypothetical protein [Bacillota bacterium]
MLGELFKKYYKNITNLLPYLIIKSIFDVVLLRLSFINFEISQLMYIYQDRGEITEILSSGYKDYIIGGIIFLLISFLTTPVFGVFIGLINKRILDNEKIDQIKIVKESLNYYFRYLGVVSVIILIIIGFLVMIVLSGIVPILGIFLIIGLFIFMIYVMIIYNVCTEYLIYYNTTVGEALKEGSTVGKKFFFRILILSIIVKGISKILDKIHTNNYFIILIIIILTIAIDIFQVLYRMNLCKISKRK